MTKYNKQSEGAVSDSLPEGLDLGGMLSHISRNTLYLVSGQVLSKVASFAYILFLARRFTIGEFGVLNLILSFVLVADITVDCGLTRLIVRDLARDASQTRVYLSNLIPLKIAIALLGYIVLLSIVWGAGYSTEMIFLAAIAGVGLVPSTLALAFDSTLQARQHMLYSSLSGVVLSLSQVVLGVIVILLGFGLPAIMAAIVLAHVIYMFVLGYGAWKRGYRFGLHLDFVWMRRTVRHALPFAAIAILFIFSARAEILVLGWFYSSETVGLYSAATKFPEAASFFPMMLASAITPVLSQYHHESPEKLVSVYLWASRMLLVAILPISAFMVVFAAPIINMLFPSQYGDSAALLKIMFMAFPFISLQAINAAMLFSSDYQKRTMVLFCIATAAQYVVNLILVPRLGATGSALSMFISQALIFLLFFGCIRHWFIKGSGMLHNLMRPIVSGLLMAGVMLFYNDRLGMWIILPGIAVYGISYLLFTFFRLYRSEHWSGKFK